MSKVSHVASSQACLVSAHGVDAPGSKCAAKGQHSREVVIEEEAESGPQPYAVPQDE